MYNMPNTFLSKIVFGGGLIYYVNLTGSKIPAG